MKPERIDKMLSLCLSLSRGEVKKLLCDGVVTVDGDTVLNGSLKIFPDLVKLAVKGQPLELNRYVYIMQNKPKGILCASDGKGEMTVIDILPDEYKRRGLFPAGRLDRDTTGFCLITDDGDFAHRILSPKSLIPKTYHAKLDKEFDVDSASKEFAAGMIISAQTLLPAELTLLSGGTEPICEVVIREGKYHQVKLMFNKLGLTVTQLKRVKIGGLALDDALSEGNSRYLTKEELSLINKA